MNWSEAECVHKLHVMQSNSLVSGYQPFVPSAHTAVQAKNAN